MEYLLLTKIAFSIPVNSIFYKWEGEEKIHSLLLWELYIFYSTFIFFYSFSQFHNFKNRVDIIAEISKKKLQKHLVTVSENNYDNANYVGIIND